MGRRAATSAGELADSALRVVRRSGVAGVSSRSVAAEAGVALGTVYRHVPDLQNLLAAAADRVQARFVAALGVAAPPARPLVPAVPRIAAALVEEARREPRFAELLALPPGPDPAAEGAPIRRWIADRVAASVAAGEIDPVDAEMVAAAGYGLVRGVFEQVLRRGAAWRGAEAVLATGLRGLLGPVADRPPPRA